jgi:cytidine deaminase
MSREDAGAQARQRLEALVPVALAVRANAWAPYSEFLVGCALLGANGKVYVGVNVENSSYGLCQCAERSAVGNAVSDGEKRFVGVVVATQSSPPSPPCGMCRQVLAEFADDLPILLVNPKGERLETNLAALLPMSFTRRYF